MAIRVDHAIAVFAVVLELICPSSFIEMPRHFCCDGRGWRVNGRSDQSRRLLHAKKIE